MTGGSKRRPSALQQFRRGVGEVTELFLVNGEDQRGVDGREGRLFLSKIGVKVVDVFWCFLEGKNKELLISNKTNSNT